MGVMKPPIDREYGDTLADGASPTQSATNPTIPGASSSRDSLVNYALGEVIGRGGMGEVVLARDLRIGRDVAIKRMRGVGDEDAVLRFLREAKIQARLDHPAIVPVHEVGRDAHGEPYFTMKRLAGVTLAALLESGAASRERLLRAFVDVAMAIDLAHSKRIVHRDLKPANIMLGDFGEVYVLDWGLARDIDEPASEGRPSQVATPAMGVTAIGAMLGTPGYMPPEQLEDAASVSAAADSYALGSILFEILAGQPLHPRADPIASTLEGIDPSPATRAPDRTIPPELDALCVAALARRPEERPSARVLAEDVQRYLDGDRDMAMRRLLASAELERARTAMDESRQNDAMRSAGRALALDPESPAAEIVTRLMLEPPEQPPPDLLAEIDLAEQKNTAAHARQATKLFLSYFPLLGLAAWAGIRSWALLGSIVTMSIVLSFTAYRISRAPQGRDRDLWAYAVGSATLLALTGRICTPFVIAPGVACIVLMGLLSYPTFARRAWLVICGTVLGWSIPVVLELASLVRPTWELADNALTLRSHAIVLQGPAMAFIIITTVAVFVIAALLAAGNTRTNYQMQRQLLVQRWRLGHLIPNRA
jgi:serine/threonine-protein kinase